MSMNRVVAIVLVFAFQVLAWGDQRLYLAAGDRLTVFGVDSETGNLAVMQEHALPGAGPFTFSPDRKRLYAMAGKGDEGALVTLLIDAEGRVQTEHSAPVNHRGGDLKLDRTGRFLAGNHYGNGLAMIWELGDGVYRGRTVLELELEKRAHSARFSPDNRWLLVPATAPNKVFINRFDEHSGELVPGDPPSAPGPEGAGRARQPRHLIFHPNGRVVYTTNERELPGVGVWDWDSNSGRLRNVQDIVTQPEGFDGVITTADLHLTPDQEFLYVSNRDITRRRAPTGRDSIVGFRVHPDSGRLTLIEHTPCERHPRSFAIGARGRFVFVAGQVDSKLGTYRIDPATGKLTRVGRRSVGLSPVWVEAVELK